MMGFTNRCLTPKVLQFLRKTIVTRRSNILSYNHSYPVLSKLTSQSRFLSQSSSKKDSISQPSNRHLGIQMNPDSISSSILPGNFVMQKARRGDSKKRYTELAHGYFWMIRELRNTGDKPILSNEQLIPDNLALPFPTLQGLSSLSGIKADFPNYFVRKNRSRDPDAQCTLVAISFRDFGYQLLPTWIDPFQEAFSKDDRVEIIRLNISEGWLGKWILRVPIQSLTKRNTPLEEHDRTFLYFGYDLENFRDSLRMHNVMTGYVFLLDGLGRVRFAGSGTATDEETARLIQFARDLTPSRAIPKNRHGNRRH